MNNWEQYVRKVTPYVPGEQPNSTNMIKLNTNENPYPPSPKVLEALSGFEADRLRLYPDPTASELVQALADYHGVNPENVFVGVGSDDVLAMSFLTFFNSDKPILFPDITYSFYDVWAELFRIPYQRPELNADFSMQLSDYYQENGGIVFPNPNAPTGLLESISAIEDILAHNKEVIVIVDEAYIDFGGATALPLLQQYENLMVVRTFSKSRSLAGMRIGYAIGNAKLIQYLNDAKYSFNSYTMNQTSLALGMASVLDQEYFEKTCAQIIETREWTKQELASLGFTFPDSKANFIFASHPDYSARDLFTALRKEHIYVRYFDKPRIDNYLRITIGTKEEMQILIDFFKDYMK